MPTRSFSKVIKFLVSYLPSTKIPPIYSCNHFLSNNSRQQLQKEKLNQSPIDPVTFVVYSTLL